LLLLAISEFIYSSRAAARVKIADLDEKGGCQVVENLGGQPVATEANIPSGHAIPTTFSNSNRIAAEPSVQRAYDCGDAESLLMRVRGVARSGQCVDEARRIRPANCVLVRVGVESAVSSAPGL
jgi:hypothetical protein